MKSIYSFVLLSFLAITAKAELNKEFIATAVTDCNLVCADAKIPSMKLATVEAIQTCSAEGAIAVQVSDWTFKVVNYGNLRATARFICAQ